LSKPFISIDYDGEDFPTAYEKQQLGNYEPDIVFLDDLEDESNDYGIDVIAGDLNEFFSELLEPRSLVFRYTNPEALQDRKENPIEDESDEYLRAPAFTFDAEEVELDPNLAWMDMLDDLHDTVGLFGIDRIDFSTPGEPRENFEDLETYIQKSGVHVVPDIQGVADLRYDWLKNEVEVKTYSDTIVFQDEDFHPWGERGKHMSDPKEGRWRTVNYDVNEQEIKRLTEELQREFGNVNVETFDENVIPPEVKDDITG